MGILQLHVPLLTVQIELTPILMLLFFLSIFYIQFISIVQYVQ